jgi:hypothetical protein
MAAPSPSKAVDSLLSMTERVALFKLNNTTEPGEAVRCAIILGDTSSVATPQVPFPPSWVATSKKLPTGLAATAIRNCNDLPTLKKVAAVDTRLLVRVALLSNKLLSGEGHDAILRDLVNTKRVHASKAVRAGAANWLSQEVSMRYMLATPYLYQNYSRCRGEISFQINTYSTNIERDATLLLTEAIKRSSLAVISDYLNSTHRLAPHHENTAKMWDKVLLTPSEVLGLLNPARRTTVLRRFLQEVIYSGKGKIDVELTKELITNISPNAVNWLGPKGAPRMIFTRAAVDLLLDEPTWRYKLPDQHLTHKQFDYLCSVTTSRDAHKLLTYAHGNRARLLKIKNKMGRARGKFTYVELDNTLTCLTGIDDRLIPWALSHASKIGAVDYLCGEFTIGPHYMAIPNTSSLVALLPYISEYRPYGDDLAAYISGSIKTRSAPQSYLNKLSLLVPGLAYALKDVYPKLNNFIYNELLKTKADKELSIQQFMLHGQEASLKDICDVLSAASRSAL